MSVGVVLFTRDLRLHDNPVLWHAVHSHQRVVPVFVLDAAILSGGFNRPNRAAFLADCLRDVDASLRARGAGLIIRGGDVVAETVKLARRVRADAVHVAGDVSGYAQRREQRLTAELECELVVHEDALFAVPPGRNRPSGGAGHMSVFAAYYRRWRTEPRRDPLLAPRHIALPDAVARGRVPSARGICPGPVAPRLPQGGESAGRARLAAWLRTAARGYDEVHDDLAADATSRLSPYLHFGCLSAREVEERTPACQGGHAFRRQLCWRDFYHRVLEQFPRNARSEFQDRYRGSIRWSYAKRPFEAWAEGRTGFPLVDAGMRQLRREGWMHNRARLVVGSFLTKDLGIDWRWGERHFMRYLVDGDEANNNGNWQWIASVGADPAPHYRRLYNPTRQMETLDPRGAYVRRHVPELRDVPEEYLREPWTMPEEVQQAAGCVIGRDYPGPIVDHREARLRAIERYRAAAGSAA